MKSLIQELRDISQLNRDIVDILKAANLRHPDLLADPARAAAVLKELFGLSVTQFNCIVGWYAGNIYDDELREYVTSADLGSD